MRDGHNLVFIVGSPRSGTTWLQKLLASHPLVKTGQESDIFASYIGPQLRAWRRGIALQDEGRHGIGLGCYFTEGEFFSNLHQYLDTLLNPMLGSLAANEIFLEKTPGHALWLPEIMELLPRARVIHILRDGRDVTASMLAASRDWGRHWASKTASHAAWMWTRHVHAVREFAPQIPHGQFMELRYEDLYADPAKKLREVFQFLALEWDDVEIQDAIARNQPDPKAQANATAIPLYGAMAEKHGAVVKDPSNFIRSGVPGGWKKDLSLWQKFHVWRKAGKALSQVGYR